MGQRWKRRPRPRFPNFIVPKTWRGWDQTKRKKRAGIWKVGGKDEINSRVYGALKVAGISLTTWQTATVVVLLAGGLKMHWRSLARSRSLASARTGSCANASSGYHSFALERAARALLMTVLWNYCGTSRQDGCARWGLKNARERRERWIHRAKFRQRVKIIFLFGGGSLSLLTSFLLAFPTVEALTNCVLNVRSLSLQKSTWLLENTLFYCTPDPMDSGLVTVEAGLSNAKFEFA